MSAPRAGAPLPLAAPLLRLPVTFPSAGEMAHRVRQLYGVDPDLEAVMSPEPVDIACGLFARLGSTESTLDGTIATLLADTAPNGALDPATLDSDVAWAITAFRLLDTPEHAHRVAVAWVRQLDHLGHDDYVANPVVAAMAAYVMAVAEVSRGRWSRARRWAREASAAVECEGMPGLDLAVVIRVLRMEEMAAGGVNP